MPTRVFLTVDTELMWRHHCAGLDVATIVERSLEPAQVGVGWQLAQLAAHGLKMPALAMPVRVLVMGTAQTPSLDAVLELVPREIVLERLARA